jgi:FkbH-like protein
MIELEKIKLIIWDLDETFWQGTIGEGPVQIPQARTDFLNETLARGIVHSICSKNDFDVAKNRLVQAGIWDSFVFPSINWEPKGNRVAEMIRDMGLRAVNVLFIDDSALNLKEAEYYCPEIKTCFPTELSQLAAQIARMPKSDPNRNRLKQYQVLEKKRDASKAYASNTEFLNACGIQVEIIADCLSESARLYELMMRSNQLNYTKFRQSKADFEELLRDPTIEKGMVKVRDNFGDYGVVGFFAVKDNKAIHYFFSCRTLGMLVEQYVYVKIGHPQLVVVGDVATQLDDHTTPEWINRETVASDVKKAEVAKKVLFKGPCDLLQMDAFIKETDCITREFTYTNASGILVEGHNHTATIATALSIGEDRKKAITSEFRWIDKAIFDTSLGKVNYDFVFLSLLTDGSMGVYRHKGSGEMISLCEKYYSLTDQTCWDLYVNHQIYDENIGFTKEELSRFADAYDYVDNSDWSVTMASLEKIYAVLPQTTKLVLLLGSEKPFEKDKRPSFAERHTEHAALNRLVEKWATEKPNVRIINYTNLIHNESDYVDSIDHYVKKVYYDFAQQVIQMLHEDAGNQPIEIKGRASIYKQSLIAGLKRSYRKLVNRE